MVYLPLKFIISIYSKNSFSKILYCILTSVLVNAIISMQRKLGTRRFFYE